jgi:hypothetical protein
MSLQAQITNLAVRVGTECKAIRVAMGDKTSLATVDKTSLVAAINELVGLVASATEINDLAGAGVLDQTWSADKINSSLLALKSEIIDGAPAAYDTLLELATALQGAGADIEGILTALGNRVRFDAVQALTAPQQAQARTNIGAVAAADVGDFNSDFVATFEAAIA